MLLAAAFGLPVLLLPVLALAQVVDPLGVAAATADGGISLFITYGPVVGGMYLLYQLASRIVARRAESSMLAAWFAVGKRLAIATGVLGVAGAALQAQVTGAPWTVIAMAAVAAFFKLITPTVGAPAPAPSSNSATQLGAAVLLAFAIAIGGTAALTPGCTAAQLAALKPGLVHCTAENAPAIGATVASMEADCKHDGKTDWTCVEGHAIATGVAIGGCAFLQVATATASSSSSFARTAAREAPSDDDGLAAFERYRARAAGGATFRTADGDR